MYFQRMAVVPSLWRRGVGTRLLQMVEERARKDGCECLRCTVYSESHHALWFLQKHGFKTLYKRPSKHFILLCMESLAGVVGRVGDIVSGGMPIGIDAESERGIGLGIVGGQFAVPLEERSAVLAADVQGEGRRVVTVGGMAVHAAVELRVLQQGPLPEGSQLAFVNAHVAINLIAGLEQPVGESIVDRIRRHEDAKRLEGPPLSVKSAGNGHRQGIPDAPLEQIRPTPGGKAGGRTAAGTHRFPVRRRQPYIDRLGPFHREIQRRNPGRHRNARIIGINVGPATGRNGIMRLRLACAQHEERHQGTCHFELVEKSIHHKAGASCR